MVLSSAAATTPRPYKDPKHFEATGGDTHQEASYHRLPGNDRGQPKACNSRSHGRGHRFEPCSAHNLIPATTVMTIGVSSFRVQCGSARNVTTIGHEWTPDLSSDCRLADAVKRGPVGRAQSRRCGAHAHRAGLGISMGTSCTRPYLPMKDGSQQQRSLYQLIHANPHGPTAKGRHHGYCHPYDVHVRDTPCTRRPDGGER